MKEIFKDIPSYEGCYQVSNLGRVKSLQRKGVAFDKYLKPGLGSDGYKMVVLSKDKKIRGFKVHQLVAMAFLSHERCGHKVVVDHINNIKTDNRLNNLQLITNRENSSKDRTGYSSKYVGVHLDKRNNRFIATIYNGEKQVHIGTFDTELEASEAYQKQLKIINDLRK